MHMMEYYSVLKWNEILTHATTQTPEDIMLNEISQPQKDKYCLISLLWGFRLIRFKETGSKMVVARGWGRRNGGLLFNEFQVGKMKKWKWDSENGTFYVMYSSSQKKKKSCFISGICQNAASQACTQSDSKAGLRLHTPEHPPASSHTLEWHSDL